MSTDEIRNVVSRSSWSRRGALGAALLGVVAIEGAYGCVGEVEAEEFIDDNVGETEEELITGDLWLQSGNAIFSAAGASVGIGTSNPTSTLDVVGRVNATDVSINSVSIDDRYVNEGQTASVNSAMIQDGAVGAADVNATEVQRRVSGSCPAGQSIRVINADGSVACQANSTSNVWFSEYYGVNATPNSIYVNLDQAAGVSLAFCSLGTVAKWNGGDAACGITYDDNQPNYPQGAWRLEYWAANGSYVGCKAICLKK